MSKLPQASAAPCGPSPDGGLGRNRLQASAQGPAPRPQHPVFRSAVVLATILGLFLTLELLLPLGRAVKIGADEDFELTKATLCLKGYQLYTEVWDDQPPLHTFLITQMLRHISASVLGPRLLTVGCAALLLAAAFLLVRSVSGLPAAAIATAMLGASPGFIELSSSVMQEIPALAPMLAALCLLRIIPAVGWPAAEICGGALFAAGLQMKLIGLVYLPVAMFILWLRNRESPGGGTRFVKSCLVFMVVSGLGWVVLNRLTGSAFMPQLHQAWGAHFASVKSTEYGSPEERGFDWSVFLKNWDASLPALLGAVVLVQAAPASPAALLPLLWLVLTLLVFGQHKPWWSYYYVHNSLPLCWCAAVGLASAWEYVRKTGRRSVAVACALFGLCALGWMGGRVYVQVAGIERAPRLSSCLALKQLERFKPFTTFLFSDQPIYSFYSGIPMVPSLATISLKELWSGQMSNARVVQELDRVKPGLMLLKNDGRDRPYQPLLTREYKLVYRDADALLYAHSTISKKPWFAGGH